MGLVEFFSGIRPFAGLVMPGSTDRFQTAGSVPSLLSQSMGVDSFTRTQPAQTQASPQAPFTDVIVMDDFTSVQSGNFQHGSEMVKEMLSVNPNLNISQINVGHGNTLTNMDQALTRLLDDVSNDRRALPQGLNLSMFAADASDPRVQSINQKLDALANQGVKVTTVAGKVLDANGRMTHTSVRNPGDRVVPNALGSDSNPNIIKVSASGEQITGGSTDANETGRTTSFATARAMGNLSLNSAQGQQVVQPPLQATVTKTPSSIVGTTTFQQPDQAVQPAQLNMSQRLSQMFNEIMQQLLQWLMPSLFTGQTG